MLASAAGIFFLTLYPFRLALRAQSPGIASAMLLNASFKQGGALDVFLNVLLFVPFGFGLAEKVREAGGSRKQAFVYTLLAGIVFSYTIEFAQAFIPQRDSGWGDVFTNSTGSVLGFLLFEFLGPLLLPLLSKVESPARRWVSFGRLAWIAPIYLAVWFLISIPLQRETRLTNWNPNELLVVGNDASGRFPWNGKVSQLQLWNRALPDATSREFFNKDYLISGSLEPFASYRLTGKPPFPDERHALPALYFPREENDPSVAAVNELSGKSWLQSEASVREWIAAVKQANQFSVHLVCASTEVDGARGRIMSISDPSGTADIAVQQANTDLVLWFRNPFATRSQLAWHVPDVFATNMPHDILFAYDGLYLSLYIDGTRVPRVYQLSPGTGLAHLIRRPKAGELAGYRYIYYALVFLPAGFLLGITLGGSASKSRRTQLFACLFFAAAVLLEAVLAHVGQRFFSLTSVALSFLFLFAGVSWINADGRSLRPDSASSPSF